MSDNDVPPTTDTGSVAGPELLTVQEVAAMLRVSTMTVYRLIDGGLISAVRIGRVVRPRRESVEAFLRDADDAHTPAESPI